LRSLLPCSIYTPDQVLKIDVLRVAQSCRSTFSPSWCVIRWTSSPISPIQLKPHRSAGYFGPGFRWPAFPVGCAHSNGRNRGWPGAKFQFSRYRPAGGRRYPLAESQPVESVEQLKVTGGSAEPGHPRCCRSSGGGSSNILRSRWNSAACVADLLPEILGWPENVRIPPINCEALRSRWPHT
jgi:hypothetical protein